MTPAHRSQGPADAAPHAASDTGARAAVDDVTRRLDELTALVEGARAMPMSASCMVNRGDVLAVLDEVRALLPVEFRQAEQVIRDRDEVVEEGRREAERVIAAAREERLRLIEETEIVQEALAERDRMLADAAERSEAMRQEVDDYVDTKLANFEVVLTRTLGAVERGRDKLRGRAVADQLDGRDDEGPLPGLG
ncbi:MAG: hypothetical protein ACJ74O_09575 [Frankiaceae bacterium]